MWEAVSLPLVGLPLELESALCPPEACLGGLSWCLPTHPWLIWSWDPVAASSHPSCKLPFCEIHAPLQCLFSSQVPGKDHSNDCFSLGSQRYLLMLTCPWINKWCWLTQQVFTTKSLKPAFPCGTSFMETCDLRGLELMLWKECGKKRWGKAGTGGPVGLSSETPPLPQPLW